MKGNQRNNPVDPVNPVQIIQGQDQHDLQDVFKKALT